MYSNTLTTLRKEMRKHSKDSKILLCIGSKNCIGDSLGPLVGEMLAKKLKEKNIEVIGNMQQCIDYNNIQNVIERINQKYEQPYIITIDAALSKKEYIGNVITIKEKLILGSALKKNKYQVGNIGIKGIVAEQKETVEENLLSLSKVPKKIITSLAVHISNQIYYATNE